MKIGRTDTPGFDCFILLTEGLLPKNEKESIEKDLFKKYGKVTIYNVSSRDGEGDIWTTNRFGLDKDRHDDFKDVDFDFVLFKNPEFYL